MAKRLISLREFDVPAQGALELSHKADAVRRELAGLLEQVLARVRS